jgi:hypothetical protein
MSNLSGSSNPAAVSTSASKARKETCGRDWRVFETNDDYFDYYRGYHAFWKLYGIGLPDEVLKKVYYKNALKITPRLPQAKRSRD